MLQFISKTIKKKKLKYLFIFLYLKMLKKKSHFRIKSLSNPSKKFKVHINAKQLQMTGILLLSDDINVIVVEGG